MKTDNLLLGFGYYRLSAEEAHGSESGSIKNQRMIVRNYCEQNGITLVREFVDDGWSGGNFDRPDFQEMMRQLEQGKANVVLTKDLSRLGRDMREASYYAEQFYPEHGIRYIAISDNFDSERDNVMAPFQFAMNEVYLRDGSRKVKDVLRHKREGGQYCACPPYGYRKADGDKSRLVPDEMTAPVVKRIFERAACGESSRKIAMDLNADGVIPPLKYRVLYRDNFGEAGASRASDTWNYTTVKRILKNRVYLGHTVLGKSRKISVKSKKKVRIPQESWAVTENTHVPIVTQETFDAAQENLGRGSNDYRAYDHVRKSIFSGVAVCAKCGHSLCSAGTVYNGEREKYWYLSCTHHRQDIVDPCSGVRIRYADLVELVRNDLNAMLVMNDDEMEEMARRIAQNMSNPQEEADRQMRIDKAAARLKTIDRMITKLYTDNAEGRLDDARLSSMVADLERESVGLKSLINELDEGEKKEETTHNIDRFFSLVKQYSHIDELDSETVHAFVERIEVGPKVYPPGVKINSHRNQPFRQSVKIFYKFIGELPPAAKQEENDDHTTFTVVGTPTPLAVYTKQ